MAYTIEMQLQTLKEVTFEEINECLMYSHRKTLLFPHINQVIQGDTKYRINYFVEVLPKYKSIDHLRKRINTILVSVGVCVEDLQITSTI